jgi:hypothetical protein
MARDRQYPSLDLCAYDTRFKDQGHPNPTAWDMGHGRTVLRIDSLTADGARRGLKQLNKENSGGRENINEKKMPPQSPGARRIDNDVDRCVTWCNKKTRRRIWRL